MRDKFPDLELKPPLFSDWPMGIRFESGEEGKREYDSRSRAHLQGCQQRAALFASLHPPANEIFIATDENDEDKGGP